MKDGGSAFPGIEEKLNRENPLGEPTKWYRTGMTLRDYFAAHAITYVGNLMMESYAKNGQLYTDKMVAGGAYNIADAMIKEREK